ncbi:MAG: biotin/lipoyl-binding protein [Spirochaetes bacterium]|nr:MAG: biotin/lipoyl-binding protein [Spirochaetota bacterium]
MKKSNIIYASIVGAIILAVILYFSLRHTEGDGHVHTDGETHTEESHSDEKEPTTIKEVELNEAQFKASSIELGTFSDKNLSEVIKANGYTKLPPQNQADVSVFTTGIVKTINVMEGQRVSKGQTIATIESPEFTKIQEAYLTSKSNLEYLKLEFERQKTLSDEEVNSKKVFQKTKSDYEIERARFNSLQKQLNTLHISGNGNTTATVPVIAPISGNITEIYIKIGSNDRNCSRCISITTNMQSI